MKAEIMTVTPEMAKEFLKGNTINRTVSNSAIERYALDMKNGNWGLGGNGISISKDGRLLDGQHRLLAIIRANVSVDMLVCSDVDTGMNDFDTGRRRGLADIYKLKLNSTDSLLTSNSGCAFIRSCFLTDELVKKGFNSLNVRKPTFNEIDEYVTLYRDDLFKYFECTVKGNNSLTSAKGLRKAQIYSIARAVVHSDKNSFTFADYCHFCTVLSNGFIIEEYDMPFIGLRDKLIAIRGTGERVNQEIRLRVCYAIKKYLDKSTSRINKLIESDRFSLADFI